LFHPGLAVELEELAVLTVDAGEVLTVDPELVLTVDAVEVLTVDTVLAVLVEVVEGVVVDVAHWSTIIKVMTMTSDVIANEPFISAAKSFNQSRSRIQIVVQSAPRL